MDIFSFLAENFDLPILRWIASNLHSAFGDAVMPIVTLLGDAGIFWIAMAAILLFIPKTRKIGLGMGLALVMGRPYTYLEENYGIIIPLLIEGHADFSFPSGHTIASFEAATVILLYNKKWGIAAMVLAALIAFSRLYLYVHYPTDVLASVVLGIGIAFLGKFLVEKGFSLYENRKKKTV